MTKNEIIENLYKAGKITFEEAMVLAGKPETERETTPTEDSLNSLISQENIKQTILDEYLGRIVDEYYVEDENDPDDHTNLAFDVENCVKAMEANNWTWVSDRYGVYEQEPVTVERFKSHLRTYIQDVINGVLQNYRDKQDEEGGYYYCTECGGIRVSGRIDEYNGKEYLVIKPEFILEEGEYDLEEEKWRKLL